jgi:DNA-directed RNA polymerase alpha subunit
MKYTLLSCIDSKIINSTTFYGRFELGAWNSGQGLTVANTLRRGLLSELLGTAITFVKIRGASHEYDTLPGIRECTLDILLNLKQIILKSEFKICSPQIGFINVKGPGIIRARDLKLPFFIYCVDPDQYIATLTHKGKLNIKFLIHSGKNYITHTPSSKHYSNWVNLLEQQKPINITNKNKQIYLLNNYKKWKKYRELNKKIFFFNLTLFKLKKKKSKFINYIINNNQNKKIIFLPYFSNNLKLSGKNTLITNSINNKNESTKFNSFNNKTGYFPIDAIFSPILRVNYTIEIKNSITKKESIFLEIWTNGTIDPRSAIHETVKILINLFLPLQQFKINLFNYHKSKTYFNNLTFSYLNNKIIKLTNLYYKKENLNKKINKLVFKKINKINNFKNKNFLFYKKKKKSNIFYFITINNNNKILSYNYLQKKIIKEKLVKNFKLKNKYRFNKKFNKLLNINLNNINNSNNTNNTNVNKLHSLYIKSNIKINFLEFDILNLELTPRLFFIFKKININKIGDLIIFKSNNYYYFNNEIINLKFLKNSDLFELKQSLKKYGIFIKNN